jgi:hypothetical protein
MANVAKSETFYLLPDSFQLTPDSENSAVKLTQTQNGYHAVLSFKPRYETARSYLKSQYGDDYQNLDIIELPVNSQGFRYLHETTLGSLVLKKVENLYFGPEIRVILDFTSELDRDQIQNLLSFNLVYGMVDATVVCNGTTFHDLCDQLLPSLPAFNQYQLAANDPAKARLLEDYLVLTEYRNRLTMEQKVPSATKTILDALAADDLLDDSGSCRTDSTGYRHGICQSLLKLSPFKKSLVDSITSLAKKIYPNTFNDTEISNIIVNPNLLGINEIIFPPEDKPQYHGAGIGNHEGVNIRLYKTLADGPIVEVNRSGFVAYKYWKAVYKVNRRLIEFTEGTPDGPIVSRITSSDIRFAQHLIKIRDAASFISTPQQFTWANLYDASILVPSLRTVISYLDTQITKTGLLVPNCVLYDHPSDIYAGGSWNLTGGPIGDLSLWTDRATFVWVRAGYQMIGLPMANFDKSQGYTTYSSYESSENTAVAGGFLYELKGSNYKQISSLSCLPSSF